jgi:hypothetical protein
MHQTLRFFSLSAQIIALKLYRMVLMCYSFIYHFVVNDRD